MRRYYFFIQYGLYGQYAAPLQHWFHLFFEYAAETVGMSWHVYSSDDSAMRGGSHRKQEQTTHTPIVYNLKGWWCSFGPSS